MENNILTHLGDNFVDGKGAELTKEQAIGGYKIVMIAVSASW